MWKSQPKEVIESWISALRDEASDKLTSWEMDFIDSVEGQLFRKGTLSQKQQEILERIYTEKTS